MSFMPRAAADRNAFDNLPNVAPVVAGVGHGPYMQYYPQPPHPMFGQQVQGTQHQPQHYPNHLGVPGAPHYNHPQPVQMQHATNDVVNSCCAQCASLHCQGADYHTRHVSQEHINTGSYAQCNVCKKKKKMVPI